MHLVWMDCQECRMFKFIEKTVNKSYMRYNILALLSILFFLNCTSKQSDTEVSSNSAELDLQKPTRALFLKSKDKGETWQIPNEGLPEDVQTVMINHFKDNLLLATENYGIFAFDLNFDKWTTLPLPPFTPSNIRFLHNDGENIYAALYKRGVMVSSDFGDTWTKRNDDLSDLSVTTIVTVDSTVYLGTDSGIYKGYNPSFLWDKVFEGPQIVSLNLDAKQEKIIAGTAKGVLLSDDEGASWNWILKEMSMHSTVVIDDVIFAMAIADGLHRSEDFGATWKNVDMDFPNSAYVFDVSPTKDILAASHHEGLYHSRDGGFRWELVYPTPVERIRDLVAVDGVLYGGTVRRE